MIYVYEKDERNFLFQSWILTCSSLCACLRPDTFNIAKFPTAGGGGGGQEINTPPLRFPMGGRITFTFFEFAFVLVVIWGNGFHEASLS